MSVITCHLSLVGVSLSCYFDWCLPNTILTCLGDVRTKDIRCGFRMNSFLFFVFICWISMVPRPSAAQGEFEKSLYCMYVNLYFVYIYRMFHFYFVKFSKRLLLVFLRICETNISLPDNINWELRCFKVCSNELRFLAFLPCLGNFPESSAWN